MKTKQYITNILILVLLVLWVPVTIDKFMNFASFKSGLLRQPFSDSLGYLLIYTLPTLELITVLALIMEKYHKAGLILSTILMIAFTSYIAVALLGAWDKLPCGCGSVISGMTWTQHFWFNLLFLVISLLGYFIHRSLQRNEGLGQALVEGISSAK